MALRRDKFSEGMGAKRLLSTEGEWFVDERGRRVLLRGVNLGGSSKVPSRPDGATHIPTEFTSRDVSFVGRPFPLGEANDHLRRIRHWGFNSLRLLVTWEAVEHDGPGRYDREYLDYMEELLKAVEEHRLYTVIDPHQDAWSRASGGDGAPLWTFEEVGLDLTQFDESEAAYVMQHRFDPGDRGSYPDMSWLQNAGRLAPCTMWTLFFGGRDFAPSCRVGGMSAQDYLQGRYIDAMREVASRVKGSPYVIGFETLNEPGPGWIGRLVDGSDMDLAGALFHSFTPFDAMLTGTGFPREIPYRAIRGFGIKEIRRDTLNPEKVSCWLEGFPDIWGREGVWGVDEAGEPVILRNDHFSVRDGRRVDFIEDHFAPFVRRYTRALREVLPGMAVFVVAPFRAGPGGRLFPSELPENSVNAAHWYDELTVGTKRFLGRASYDTRTGKIVMGAGNVQRMFNKQLGAIKDASTEVPGGMPTVIGEFGLCFDLDGGSAFRAWKRDPSRAWDTHVRALTMYYDALDASLLHSMLWNYTPDNDNEWGDRWNLEDFSIFSTDQRADPSDIGSGGRAVEGFSRPHFVRVSGTPLGMSFDMRRREFRCEFDADPGIDAPTVIYVPKVHYPGGVEVELSGGEIEETGDRQLLALRIKESGIHTVVIKPSR